MRLFDLVRNLFKKKVLLECKCGNMVDPESYNKKIKRHVIGSVYKDGKTYDLYCDGKERGGIIKHSSKNN